MKLPKRYRPRHHRDVERLRSRIARARYFRGHGVHSPFVYAIVRQVFMKHELSGKEHALYDTLRRCDVNERRAVQLQNLYTHCKYKSFGLNRASGIELGIATPEATVEELTALAAEARRCGTTLCILDPYADKARRECCQRLILAHPSTSIDNRAYLLLFNGDLPKQHFKL